MVYEVPALHLDGCPATGPFGDLQLAVTRTTILRHPDFTRPFEHTDASDLRVDSDASPYVIEYWPKALDRAQRNYAVREKELLAIVAGIEKFQSHLRGSHFTVWTDHH